MYLCIYDFFAVVVSSKQKNGVNATNCGVKFMRFRKAHLIAKCSQKC